jgi:hypothetical protein
VSDNSLFLFASSSTIDYIGDIFFFHVHSFRANSKTHLFYLVVQFIYCVGVTACDKPAVSCSQDAFCYFCKPTTV